MSNYRAVYKRPSWGSIIFFMIIFFPIGIYLLIKRNTRPKYSDVYVRNQYHSSPHENYNSRDNDTSIKRGSSWGVIILLLFLFFPVGIPMLIKKVTSEKYRYDENGKTMIALGRILIGLGIVYGLMGFSGDLSVEHGGSLFGTFLTGLFVCVGGGSVLVYQGNRLRRRAYRINRYTSIISNRKEYSLRNIAAAYPADYESTCRDLQFMIDYGFLLNSYLDLQREELVMAKSKKTSLENHEERVFPKSDTSSVIIKCPGCGAMNKLFQEGAYECEYCGSPLQ